MSHPVHVTIDQGIAEVVLNRPEKLNAISKPMFEQLAQAGRDLGKEQSLRAVILRGEGPSFCAGIDLSAMQDLAASTDGFAKTALTLPDGEIANFFQAPTQVWRALQVPVIAALQGVAFGAGFQIALGADFRIAAPDTRMALMEMKWGIIPDMGVSQTLPRLVREDQAKDLVMTGRIVDAKEAAAMGLVTRLADDPVAAARDMARDLASKSPDAIKASKRLVQETWLAAPAQGLRLEAELQAQLMGSIYLTSHNSLD